MKIAAVIPARLGSTRFPEKMLADRTGKPLIQHVYERVRQCMHLDRIIIATDHHRIFDAVRSFGGDVVMTRADHPNGTSRIAEVAESLDVDLIANVQGDEPEIEPAVIEAAIDALVGNEIRTTSRDRKEPGSNPVLDGCSTSTVATPFLPDDDPNNPNIVKVVCDLHGRALYFSRSLIPFCRDSALTQSPIPDRQPSISPAPPLRHIGIYVYRRAFLAEYVKLAPTPLEQAEKLEQLRVLEHGYPIAVAVVPPQLAGAQGIDTPEQYEAFVARFRTGPT